MMQRSRSSIGIEHVHSVCNRASLACGLLTIRGTSIQDGNCLEGDKARELVMFNGTYDRTTRADRYRQTAFEYANKAKETSTPYMRAYLQQIAEEYLVRADGELRVFERESMEKLTSAAEARSSR
jgi:hypothetical protein